MINHYKYKNIFIFIKKYLQILKPVYNHLPEKTIFFIIIIYLFFLIMLLLLIYSVLYFSIYALFFIGIFILFNIFLLH